MKYNVGSLFAGVGGICLGFLEANYKGNTYNLVFANEIDSYACVTYQTNFKHPLMEGDIYKFLDPSLCDSETERIYYESQRHYFFDQKIDVLNGGFPCQAFSIAGEQKGFKDARGNLFLTIIELIHQMEKKTCKPRILFLENVRNLLSHDHGNTYRVIKSELEKCGYIITEKVINTMDYTDLPQNRERIYIIGFLNKEDYDKFDNFRFLEKYKNHKTHNDRENDVKDIIDNSVTFENSPKYYYTKERYPIYFSESGINLSSSITEKYQFYQCRRGMYVRKNKSDVCPTLTANMGTGGHNVPLILVDDGIRKLTPTETFRLQGFPVGHGYELPKTYAGRPYPDSQLYKQSGNAVSVDVIKILATELLKILVEN